jgi:hypothetical protein
MARTVAWQRKIEANGRPNVHELGSHGRAEKNLENGKLTK